jgi:hypothetical protein
MVLEPILSTFSLQFFYTDSFEKAIVVIRCIQIIYFHFPIGRRGMDKLIVTDIDPHMSIIPLPFEKDQIAFL